MRCKKRRRILRRVTVGRRGRLRRSGWENWRNCEKTWPGRYIRMRWRSRWRMERRRGRLARNCGRSWETRGGWRMDRKMGSGSICWGLMLRMRVGVLAPNQRAKLEWRGFGGLFFGGARMGDRLGGGEMKVTRG